MGKWRGDEEDGERVKSLKVQGLKFKVQRDAVRLRRELSRTLVEPFNPEDDRGWFIVRRG
jgi:hypothetical protein